MNNLFARRRLPTSWQSIILPVLINVTITGLVSLLLLWQVLPSFAQAVADCQVVTVRAGDSLSRIAGQYLGNVGDYGKIIQATNTKATTDRSFARIDNPSRLEVGWKLCVPTAANSSVAIQPVPTVPNETLVQPIEDLDQWYKDRIALRWDGTGPHPLTIEYLRQQTYPGSDILIEQTLPAGTNYNRYLVSYQSEGLKIFAYMTVPTGQRPSSGWPVIIFNHGYIPPEIYRSTERYIAYVDGFARNGYIVFRSDYRGHGFSEGQADGAYGLPDYTIDVLNAVAAIKRYAEADEKRIGMWGHSLGGYVTLRAMVVNGDIKAGVIWAGVVASYPDLLSRWTSRPPASIPQRARRWRQVLIDQWGEPTENPQFWDSISANTFVANLSGPIQLHHGTNDPDVPYSFSASLNDQITAVSGSVEYFVYEGDNHNLSVYFNTAMQRSIAFFDQNVKGQQQ